MNRMIENYLRCFCTYEQDNWAELLPAAEFAYNSAISDELGMSPFEMDLGWKPKSPLDFLSRKQSAVQSVEDFKETLRTSLKYAQFAFQVARSRHISTTAGESQPHKYKVGDKVWINKTPFKDAYSKSQEKEKLTARRFGPFTIMKLVGRNVLKLELPAHLNIHPIIHVVHTTPYFCQPQDIGQPIPQRPCLFPTPTGEEYKVDKLLSHRKRERGYQFLTLMKGSPTS